MNRAVLFAFILTAVFAGHSKEEWKSRTIYQLLTDRFARSDNNRRDCSNLGKYCGGTFRGIINNLDYIHEMGFDAIWISPVIDNIEGGYHGYWARNWNKINYHFGNDQDLKALVEACHKRGMWIMVDVVANHVGPIGTSYDSIYPFNKAEHYHDKCDIRDQDWDNDQWRVENCRLSELPDLKQENTWVADTLCNWVKDLVQNFNLDGIRVDTVPEVPKWYWSRFKGCAGVFSLGEVFNKRIDYLRGYIGPLDSVLNYALFWNLRNTFKGESFMSLVNRINEVIKVFDNEQNYMGLFVDNHDNARFLNNYENWDNLIGALVFTLFYPGIPIVYYGDEQGYDGGNDPDNREILWNNMNRNSRIYQALKKTINVRKTHQVWNHPYKDLWHTSTMLAFTRGEVLIILTNRGSGVDMEIPNVPFSNGSRICSVLDGGCTIVNNGKAHIKLEGNQTGVFVKS
jgi:alpha-amylase